jgi:hypothetical protein
MVRTVVCDHVYVPVLPIRVQWVHAPLKWHIFPAGCRLIEQTRGWGW